MPEAGRERRFRPKAFSAPSFPLTTWLCVGAVLLGIWSLGHSSIANRRRERAAAWLRSAGANVRVEENPYWHPPLGGTRSARSYHVRFPPSRTLTPYEIESLFALPGLRTLDLSSNPVDDELAVRLSGIRSLERLNLSRTSVTDVGLRAVATLPALQHLAIGATPTTAEAVREVEQQRNWPGFYSDWLRWRFWKATGEAAGVGERKLEITPKTMLTPAAARMLREMPSLDEITVLHNTPPISLANWRALGEATAIRHLHIRGGIDSAGAAGLSEFRSVEVLTVNGPDLDDSVIEAVSLDKLRALSMVLGRFDASGFASLKGAPHLEELALTGPVLAGNDGRAWRASTAPSDAWLLLQAYRQGPRYAALSEIPKLRVLTLDKVALDAAAIRNLSQIPELRELNLLFVYVVDHDAVDALKLLGPHPTLERVVLPRFLPETKLVELVQALRSGPNPKQLKVHSRSPGVQRILRTIPGIAIQN